MQNQSDLRTLENTEYLNRIFKSGLRTQNI